MKKNQVLKIITFLLFIALATIIFSNFKNETYEDVSTNLLNDIFTASYDEYNKSFEHQDGLSNEEFLNYIHRDDIFKDYFTKDGYNQFLRNVYNLIYFQSVRKDKFDIVVKSVDLDMRNTSDENIKVCYFTVDYELIFLNEKRESITMSTDGEMTLVKESNLWLVNFVSLKIRQLNFD